MKKLHSLALYALATSLMTLNAGYVSAQQTAEEEAKREQQRVTQEREQERSQPKSGTTPATPGMVKGNQGAMPATSQMSGWGYIETAPANGMHGSKLIGANVKTANDEDVGEVKDLIIDEKGQVVAVLIGVGGVMGMGEKDIAVGWDNLTRSGDSKDFVLRINRTRDDLRSVPKYEWRK